MTNAIYPLNEPELDVDSRPLPDPLTVLRKFRDFYVRTETAYRESRYLLLGTVYAEALRIFDSVEGLKRFYEEEYWRGRSYRQPRGIRDVFRDVCAYVTNATDTEGRKTASKYAKVLWHLKNGGVRPEHAESAIRCSGGIEAIARSGLCPPPTFDPNSFCDDDDDDDDRATQGEENDSECWIVNMEALNDYVRKQGSVQGEQVHIEALCQSAPDGPAFEITSVQRIGDPMDALSDHARDLEYVNAASGRPLVVEISPERLAKVLELPEGDRATLLVEHRSSDASGWIVIKARKFSRESE